MMEECEEERPRKGNVFIVTDTMPNEIDLSAKGQQDKYGDARKENELYMESKVGIEGQGVDGPKLTGFDLWD